MSDKELEQKAREIMNKISERETNPANKRTPYIETLLYEEALEALQLMQKEVDAVNEKLINEEDRAYRYGQYNEELRNQNASLQERIKELESELKIQDDANDILTRNIKELEERCERLEKAEKKAFWWSAEFTNTVHKNKIEQAWNDYKALTETKGG